MRVLLILGFALLLSFRSVAQLDSSSVTNQKINNKIHELKKDKIDTMLCYYIYCTGRPPRLMLKDSCVAYDVKYLLWCNCGKFFMQRFDECKSYQAQLFYQNPFYLALRFSHKLATEKILPKTYSKHVGNRFINFIEVDDHSCFSTFDFYLRNKFLHKEIDLQDIVRLLDDGKHLNKNYQHNRNTIIASIRIEMEQMVSLYNTKVDGK